MTVAVLQDTVTVRDHPGVDYAGLRELAHYLNSYVPLILGLYLSLALSRWWDLRMRALGKVFDSLANVNMLYNCLLPGPDFEAQRVQLLRYGLLSILLLVK